MPANLPASSPLSTSLAAPKIRLPAEWEPQAAVQLTFPHADSDWADSLDDVLPVFLEITAAIARFQPVLIVCENVKSTKSLLASRLPDLPADRILCAQIPSNDTWARDHAGITILEKGRPVVLDFMFNGWGLKFPADRDNQITARLFRKGIFSQIWKSAGIQKRIKRRVCGLVLEGGSLESDGCGTLMTTSECLLSANRNPQFSKTRIEKLLKKQLGFEQILWLEHGALEGDDTDAHIDTLARFCDPETIAFQACDDPTDPHFSSLKKMEMELRAFRQLNGEPYKLVALPWPQACFSNEDGHRLPATYANFLLINGAVLAPTYRVPQDAAALAVLKTCFPDREIIEIDCRPVVEWHGSLHCLTMQFPAV